jgi:nicotinate-nucleotide adenylyltransferase
MRVGLLGGSFNPAHGGHVHISRLALKHLNLDQVWWLVSPQNPLKPAAGMAPFADRLDRARAITADPRIRVTDMELRFGTIYAVDTLRRLFGRYPHTRFVWIMGADNLIEAPLWKRWRPFFAMVPIAVIARPSYSYRALSSKAARCLSPHRVGPGRGPALAGMTPPAWMFLPTRLEGSSATAIRLGAAVKSTGQRIRS